LLSIAAAAPQPVAGDCAGGSPDQPSHCIYRAAFPSTGLVSRCRTDRDCRVGYYYGDPEKPVWLEPPPNVATLPRPEVIWHEPTFAQIRFAGGTTGDISYFFEAKRRRLSSPQPDVLAVDAHRLLMAQVDGRALAVRQIYSAREVARIARDWAPGLALRAALTAIHFDPDGRLTFTWLQGAARAAITERVSVPSLPR